MQTVQSRIYTNVILTVIAVLLAVLAFRPMFEVSQSAYAQDDAGRGSLSRGSLSLQGDDAPPRRGYDQYGASQGDAGLAAATQDVANANRDIADAILQSAEIQAQAMDQVAKAFIQLGN